MRPNRYFWLIELLAWWEGRINCNPLCEYFDLTRQSASRHINGYISKYPETLIYNPKFKAYIPTKKFRLNHSEGDVSEYLNWVTGITQGAQYQSVSFEVIPHPPRKISPQIIRSIVAAIRDKKRIEVDYISISSADSDGRIITPHTFVNTGLRWHVRGYCERNQGYRDFVLSRFRGQPELEDGQSPHTVEKDSAWNKYLTLIIQPDSRLSDERKYVLEQDYCMENGKLYITTRAALAQYTLQDLQVNTKTLDANPTAQQLVLSNYDEVQPWLF